MFTADSNGPWGGSYLPAGELGTTSHLQCKPGFLPFSFDPTRPPADTDRFVCGRKGRWLVEKSDGRDIARQHYCIYAGCPAQRHARLGIVPTTKDRGLCHRGGRVNDSSENRPSILQRHIWG